MKKLHPAYPELLKNINKEKPPPFSWGGSGRAYTKMKSGDFEKNRLKILFISIDESATLLNMRNYVLSKTNTEFDFMFSGLLTSKNNRTEKDIYFLKSSGEKISKNLSYGFVLKPPFRDLIQFVLQCYALFLLFKITKNKTYDICIAETPTFGMLARILKRMGKCKMTIFHITDIYSIESKDALGNFLIFLQKKLRTISYKNDVVWYMHEALKKWDKEQGFFSNHFFIEGESFDPREVLRHRQAKKKINQICYLGRMNKYSGLDVAIKSINLIKQKIPDIFLKIIGGYSESDILYYKDLAKREGILDKIQFLGFIPDRKETRSILAESALGMAVYSPDKRNGTLYTIPGKVLDYLQAGTPVVITKQGPQIKEDIERFKAGILVEYDSKDTADKIIDVLLQKSKMEKLQRGVLEMTQTLSHDKVQARLYKKIYDYYKNTI